MLHCVRVFCSFANSVLQCLTNKCLTYFSQFQFKQSCHVSKSCLAYITNSSFAWSCKWSWYLSRYPLSKCDFQSQHWPSHYGTQSCTEGAKCQLKKRCKQLYVHKLNRQENPALKHKRYLNIATAQRAHEQCILPSSSDPSLCSYRIL